MRLTTIGPLILAIVLGAACDKNSPTSPTTSSTSPFTDTFTGELVPGSGASRAFTTTSGGVVVVELIGTSLSPDAFLGLAVGIPTSGMVGCSPTVITRATIDTQLTAAVDAGTYCVRVFDVDGLPGPVAFTVGLTYP